MKTKNVEVEPETQRKPIDKKAVSPVGHHIKSIAAVCLVGAILLWGPTIYSNLSTRTQRYDLNKAPINNVPKKEMALIFGAGVLPNGQPTPYLKWRVETGAKLYHAHRVNKLLLSADNSSKHYNEPIAMQKLAEHLGVPAKDIVLDYAGFNTYDSCYRAKFIFQLKEAILVTQGYHLPRAIMACRGLGINVIGIGALHTSRDFTGSYIMREWVSTDKTLLQLIFKPHPTILGPAQPVR